MGVHAVEELISGRSNLVVCEREGSIISVDINYALVLDRMYKNKLKDGDLDAFSPEDIAKMKAEIKRKQEQMAYLNEVGKKINL